MLRGLKRPLDDVVEMSDALVDARHLTLPFALFPADVLKIIFSQTYVTSLRLKLVLARVCKRWRALVLPEVRSLPSLTSPQLLNQSIATLTSATSLRVVGPLPRPLPHRLRSVHIAHRDIFEHNCAHFTNLRALTTLHLPILMGCSCPYTLLTNNASTLTHLSVSLQRRYVAVTDERYRELMRPLKTIVLPRLESIDWVFDTNLPNHFYWNALLHSLVRTHAPQLRSLRLRGAAEHYPDLTFGRLTNLTELHLDALDPSVAGVFKLDRLPRSVALHVTAPTPVPIMLPLLGNVASVTRELYEADLRLCTRLVEMAVKIAPDGAWGMSEPMIALHSSRITRLHVSVPAGIASPDVSLLLRFTRLARLDLSCDRVCLERITQPLPALVSLSWQPLAAESTACDPAVVMRSFESLLRVLPRLCMLKLVLTRLSYPHEAAQEVTEALLRRAQRAGLERVVLVVPPYAVAHYRPLARKLECVDLAIVAKVV